MNATLQNSYIQLTYYIFNFKKVLLLGTLYRIFLLVSH